jgi:hypothetical protein
MFLRELYSHMEWADARVWMAVLASETAWSDELLLDTLFHLHLAQHAFLEIWKGDRVTLRERSDFDSAIEIQRWARPWAGARTRDHGRDRVPGGCAQRPSPGTGEPSTP